MARGGWKKYVKKERRRSAQYNHLPKNFRHAGRKHGPAGPRRHIRVKVF